MSRMRFREEALMDLKTKFIIRALIGFSLGLLFGAFMLMVGSDDAFMLNRPLVFAHIVCSGIMGLVGNGGAIVYDLENWGIIKATFIHFTVTFMTMIAISEVLGWFSHDILLFVFLAFTAVYVIIWLIEYAIGKKQVKELNAGLQTMMQKGADTDGSN
jgi:hypothetical protein